MGITDSILIPFFWAVFGVILSLIVPDILFTLKQRLYPNRLNKKWFTEYQGFDHGKDVWVKENVNAVVKNKEIRFTTSIDGKLKHIIEGSIVKENYIIGVWKSTEKSTDDGVCMYMVSPRGDTIYGYWLGQDKVGGRRVGRRVFARNQKDINEAKVLLNAMQQPEFID